MKKIGLIFDTVQVVNAFILLISMLDKNDAVFMVSFILCWILIFIRFISCVIIIKKIKKNNNRCSKNKNQFIVSIKLSKLQIDNDLMIIGKLNELIAIINSNGSYYEAQRKYMEIKQTINELTEEELKSFQKQRLLEMLEGLSKKIIDLELKR